MMVRTGVIAGIALVVLGAASATPWVVTLRLPTLSFGDQPVPEQPDETPTPQPPAAGDSPFAEALGKVLVVLFVLAVGVAVALGVAWLVRRLQEAWRPDDEPAPVDRLGDGDLLTEVADVDIASLASAVARAEAHLAGARAPGDAVVAAWVALEDEAELQGTGRRPAQTATEFTSELLAHTPAPADAVAELRRLYHRARFTSHPVGRDDVHRARAALARIAESLDAVTAPADPEESE